MNLGLVPRLIADPGCGQFWVSYCKRRFKIIDGNKRNIVNHRDHKNALKDMEQPITITMVAMQIEEFETFGNVYSKFM